MSADSNDLFARITPVEPESAERVLNTWSLLRNCVVTQSLAILFGASCVSLPMLAGLCMGWIINASTVMTLGLGMLFTLIGAAVGLISLHYYGLPVLRRSA